MLKTKLKKTITFIDNHSTTILLVTLTGVIAAIAYDSSKRETLHENEFYVPDNMIKTMVETGASVVGDTEFGTLRLTLNPYD